MRSTSLTFTGTNQPVRHLHQTQFEVYPSETIQPVAISSQSSVIPRPPAAGDWRGRTFFWFVVFTVPLYAALWLFSGYVLVREFHHSKAFGWRQFHIVTKPTAKLNRSVQFVAQ